MNQAKKKAFYLITKAFWGGAQRYVFDLATHLPKDRFEVVVAYGEPGKLSERLANAGVRTIRLPSLGRNVAIISDIASFFEILRSLRAERPDVLHLNSSKAAALGALAGRIAGTPNIVFTAHGWPFRERRNVLSLAFIWLISWMTALLATTVICVSESDRLAAEKMPFVSKKTVRIYNGIDLQKPFAAGDVIRFAFPRGARVTGTIGELTKNKDQASLIEQARDDASMHVAIVGEGEQRAYLEQKIKEYDIADRVKLFGYLPAEEVLRGFDTFALPSIKEGLPYVLIEARAAGIPIVANRVGGVGEILDMADLNEFSLDRMLARTIALY